MILKPQPVHNTSEFHWDPATGTFTAEASELRWPPGWPPLGRVYDDAADEGFTLVSQRSGKENAVVLEAANLGDESSGGWKQMTFVPADIALRNSWKVVVFND